MHDTNEVDCDEGIPYQKPCRSHGRPRRWPLEALLPDLVEGVEVAQVGEEDLGLGNVIEAGSCGLEGLCQVLEGVVGLAFDV